MKDPNEERIEREFFPKPKGFDPYQFDFIETRPLSEMDAEVRKQCEELNEFLKDILEPDPSFIKYLNDNDS